MSNVKRLIELGGILYDTEDPNDLIKLFKLKKSFPDLFHKPIKVASVCRDQDGNFLDQGNGLKDFDINDTGAY